jgi:hypothetical protein
MHLRQARRVAGGRRVEPLLMGADPDVSAVGVHPGDRAVAAERMTAELQTQIDELRREVRKPVEVDQEDDDEDDAPEDAALVSAIQKLEDSLAKRLDNMLRATLADRIMVPDELGTPRSRVVLGS